jgi:hypothetical protein
LMEKSESVKKSGVGQGIAFGINGGSGSPNRRDRQNAIQPAVELPQTPMPACANLSRVVSASLEIGVKPLWALRHDRISLRRWGRCSDVNSAAPVRLRMNRAHHHPNPAAAAAPCRYPRHARSICLELREAKKGSDRVAGRRLAGSERADPFGRRLGWLHDEPLVPSKLECQSQ